MKKKPEEESTLNKPITIAAVGGSILAAAAKGNKTQAKLLLMCSSEHQCYHSGADVLACVSEWV